MSAGAAIRLAQAKRLIHELVLVCEAMNELHHDRSSDVYATVRSLVIDGARFIDAKKKPKKKEAK